MERRYWSPSKEALRLELNAWLRRRHPFDGLVDLDPVLRDPAPPDRLNPDFDSGDHLHPSALGNAAIASAIDLDALGSGGCS